MKSVFTLVLLLSCSAATADVELQFSDGTVGIVNDGRVLFGDDKGSVLFVPGEEGMIIISHEDRTWMRLKPGFANAVADQMQAQVDAMLAGMPPEQQAMVRQQMAGMMPPKPEDMPEMQIRKTGKSDEVAGFDCEEAEITYEDGKVEEVVCVATADELDIGDEDFAAMINAMKGMAEIASVGGAQAPQLDFSKLDGIPVRTRARDKGVDNEIVSLSTSSVDPGRLKVPDGYREASVEDMMGQ
ncbi:MAG: DUF4412 domain-containing protein [Woeseia sp.]